MQQLFKVGHVESLHLDGRAHAKRERERRVWMVLLFFGGRPWSRAERGSCVRRGVEVGPRYTFRFCYFLPPVPSKLFHNCCSCRPRPPPPPPPAPWLSARSWAGGGLRSPLSIGILLVRPRPLSIESILGSTSHEKPFWWTQALQKRKAASGSRTATSSDRSTRSDGDFFQATFSDECDRLPPAV
jgi:hypothetical protein